MKDLPLTVEIKDDELQIRIGIGTLKFVAERCPLFYDHQRHLMDEVYIKITDENILARDVAGELKNEQEDGTTPVHLLLDEAIANAMYEGSEAFEDIE